LLCGQVVGAAARGIDGLGAVGGLALDRAEPAPPDGVRHDDKGRVASVAAHGARIAASRTWLISSTGRTTTGPPASALDRWVTNNTRMTIAEICISRVGAQLWNIDLLGTDFLAPASSVWINIDDAEGCRFDFKTVFDDGTTQIRRNVNVCGVEKYAITFR
jgi:hypothetical protein